MLKVIVQTFCISFFLLCFPEAYGQPVLPSDLKKPKKYENRKLGAEKSAEKKFKGPRKFIQNTVTHYNWYFNANTKLNEVIERAKLAHKDDALVLGLKPKYCILGDWLQWSCAIPSKFEGLKTGWNG